MKLIKQVTSPGGRIADYSHLLFGRVQVAQSFQRSIIFVSTQRWGAMRFDDLDRVHRAAAFMGTADLQTRPDKRTTGARHRRKGGVS